MLYEDVFETIDDYRGIDMELPVLDESGKITMTATQQSIAMSHFPRLSALAEEHGDWPSNRNEFADMAPTTEGWLLYGHAAPPHQIGYPMNAVIQSLTFHNDKQKRSAAPLI